MRVCPPVPWGPGRRWGPGTQLGSESHVFILGFDDMSFLLVSQLLARRDALREKAATRRKLLEDSRLLQKLYEDSDDLKNWINKKKKLADDEDYKVSRVFGPWAHSSGLFQGTGVLELKGRVNLFTEKGPGSLKA